MRELERGERIGSWIVDEKLGQGGMGSVWAVRHHRLGKRAAMKVIRTKGVSNEERNNRLLREAMLLAKIRHPNVVEVLDSDMSPGGLVYVVMALLEGASLRELMHLRERRGIPFEPEEVVLYLFEALQGLTAIHHAEIIHRDIKPENVFIVEGGHVVLIDLGISRAKQFQTSTTQNRMGTPDYMAPEQFGQGKISEKVDVYALGVVLYELLTGRWPYRATGEDELQLTEVIGRHCAMRPIHPRELGLAPPPPLVELAFRMLDKDPTTRPSGADCTMLLRQKVAPALGFSLPGPSVFGETPGSSKVAQERARAAFVNRETEVTRGPSPELPMVVLRPDATGSGAAQPLSGKGTLRLEEGLPLPASAKSVAAPPPVAAAHPGALAGAPRALAGGSIPVPATMPLDVVPYDPIRAAEAARADAVAFATPGAGVLSARPPPARTPSRAPLLAGVGATVFALVLSGWYVFLRPGGAAAPGPGAPGASGAFAEPSGLVLHAPEALVAEPKPSAREAANRPEPTGASTVPEVGAAPHPLEPRHAVASAASHAPSAPPRVAGPLPGASPPPAAARPKASSKPMSTNIFF